MHPDQLTRKNSTYRIRSCFLITAENFSRSSENSRMGLASPYYPYVRYLNILQDAENNSLHLKGNNVQSVIADIIWTEGKLLLGRGVNRSYSQFGEDAILQAIFRNKKNGKYVDIGCYHPVLYSNTYALYRKGWEGIVVDPNTRFKPLYSFFRSRDTFVTVGIGEEGSRTYYEFSDGAYNTFDAVVAEEPKRKKLLKRTSKVAIVPLSSILSKIQGPIDLVNIDVEGMDYAVLQSHTWDIKPEVIAVEAQPDSESGRLLFSKGYKLVGVAGLTSIWRLNLNS